MGNQTFKISNSRDIIKGETSSSLELSIVYCAPHISIKDLIDTCSHEAIHMVLIEQGLEIEVEHIIIDYMQWISDEMLDLED